MLAPQLQQGGEQGAVRQAGRGLETREQTPGGHPDTQNAQRRKREHGTPAPVFGHQPADHPRQQDAQQQAGHHGPHHLATPGHRRQRGRGRHDVLRQRGRDANRQAGQQEAGQSRCHRRQQQRQAQRCGLDEDDASPVVAITQRDQQQDAQGVTQLGQGGQQTDSRRRGPDVRAQRPQHGLAVVQRRHAQAGPQGQKTQQDRRQTSRQNRLRLGTFFIRQLHTRHRSNLKILMPGV